MIYYLVTRRHAYTITDYLESWGKPIASGVRVVPYGALPGNASLPFGTYVFSDVERLGPPQMALATRVAEKLERAGLPVLNHPGRSQRRTELLDRLHRAGKNRFRAARALDLAALRGGLRYPVFVREEAEHTGSLSPLLHDEQAVRRAVLLLTMEGFDPASLLVVEFCDTKDEAGLYRKYAAFRVGDRVFPRSMLFSKSWMQKDMDLLEPEHILENRAYWKGNPHEEELMGIFRGAEIQYGRIDYGLLEGAIQVWEINTNPIIARPPEAYEPARHAYHQMFADVFNEAFARLDTAGDTGPRVTLDWGLG